MDYLEWELERQRGALRALLGGGSRDSEALREAGAERVPAGMEAAGISAAGQAERFAAPAGAEAGQQTGRAAVLAGTEAGQTAGRALSGTEAGRPAKRDAGHLADRFPIRRNGTGHPEEAAGGSDSPVSAWEQVLAGEGNAPGQTGWDGPEEQTSETPARPPREGTGPLAALPGASGEELTARGREPAETPERAGTLRAGEPGGKSPVGTYTTDLHLANHRPAWAPEAGEPTGGAGYRDGGGAASRVEDSARALSRAVQRDARRYDGGFTIY